MSVKYIQLKSCPYQVSCFLSICVKFMLKSGEWIHVIWAQVHKFSHFVVKTFFLSFVILLKLVEIKCYYFQNSENCINHSFSYTPMSQVTKIMLTFYP